MVIDTISKFNLKNWSFPQYWIDVKGTILSIKTNNFKPQWQQEDKCVLKCSLPTLYVGYMLVWFRYLAHHHWCSSSLGTHVLGAGIAKLELISNAKNIHLLEKALAPTFMPSSAICVVSKWNMFSLGKAKGKGKWSKYPKVCCFPSLPAFYHAFTHRRGWTRSSDLQTLIKVLQACKVTYTQILGIRVRASVCVLGAGISPATLTQLKYLLNISLLTLFCVPRSIF